jgi:hypothetical protein
MPAHPHLWRDMDAAFDLELAQSKLAVQEFLKSRHPAWNLVGRVHFNLAEYRKDEDAPFAFLATYTTQLSAEAKAQHLPLGKALQEYAGARNRQRFLSLLMPVQRASEHCPWLKAMVVPVFVRAWDLTKSLVMHCFAGISRRRFGSALRIRQRAPGPGR